MSWGEKFEYNYGAYYFTRFTFCNGNVYYYIDKIQKKDKYYYIRSKRRDTSAWDERERKEYLKSSDYEKIKTVTENLKLRADEATTSNVRSTTVEI